MRINLGLVCVFTTVMVVCATTLVVSKPHQPEEVTLSPKLLSDIRTVLDCPHGMTAQVKDGQIVMAWCVK